MDQQYKNNLIAIKSEGKTLARVIKISFQIQ